MRDGPALNRSSISGTAASHPSSSWVKAGRLNAACASMTSAGKSDQAMPSPVR